MTEVKSTRKGLIKVTQVACIEVDLDDTISNVFPLAGKNTPVESLEELADIFLNSRQSLYDWADPDFEITDVTIIDPEVEEKAADLRKQAEALQAEANKLIKG